LSDRLIEIVLPEGRGEDISELLHDFTLLHIWQDVLAENLARIKILVSEKDTEPILDVLDGYLATLPGAVAMLMPVDATVPRTAAGDIPAEKAHQGDRSEKGPLRHVTRHELYDDISRNTGISFNYAAMVVLSAVVAAIGLVRNDMAIIIGAMVLAPLLVPNVALALANTLGDTELAVKALKTAGAGMGLALGIGILIGAVVKADPAIPAVASRTDVGWSDLVLAFTAGSAGVLAFTGGAHLSLIGVMVAVALMPPLVTSGILFGSGCGSMGFGALELAVANIICVNLAGILTFRIQGIRPATWWETAKARKSTIKALWIWMTLLAVLMLIILQK